MHYKTIFISDLHLLTKGCSSDELIDFLDNNTCDRLVLVGDILDGWRARSSIWKAFGFFKNTLGVFFDEKQARAIKKLLSKISRVRTDYIIGNHDDFLKELPSDISELGNLRIQREMIYESNYRGKYLVIHGDQFDGIVKYHEWLAFLADYSLNTIMYVSRWIQRLRSMLGFKNYWSLSYVIKHKVKQGVEAVMHYQESIVKYCKIHGYQGVICGHSHYVCNETIDGVHYLNCGDWVDSCTAVVETTDGMIKTIYWRR